MFAKRRSFTASAALLLSCLLLLSEASTSFAFVVPSGTKPLFGTARRTTALNSDITTDDATTSANAAPSSGGATLLDSLASMTTISIDSCDLDVVQKYADTGDVTDATTNPFFVWQMASGGDKRYEKMVTDAIIYAKEEKMTPYGFDELQPVIDLAMDKLAVNLGTELADIVPRYISTEVDVRLCHDTQGSVDRARKIVDMYKEMGVPKDRVLIEMAGTWECIRAAEILESEDGISTKISLVFSFLQAAAAAQAGVTVVSPFPGRILDWNKDKSGKSESGEGYVPDADPGVLTTKRIYSYLRYYGYDTICMPASWRPSGTGGDVDSELDEVLALAGVDEMNVPPRLLDSLMDKAGGVVRRCDPVADAAVCTDPNFKLNEETFGTFMDSDRCAKEKLQEGIDKFKVDAENLAEIIVERFN